jgi:hypothetical protein
MSLIGTFPTRRDVCLESVKRCKRTWTNRLGHHSTRGRSGQIAPHGSLSLRASLRGQSAVNSSVHVDRFSSRSYGDEDGEDGRFFKEHKEHKITSFARLEKTNGKADLQPIGSIAKIARVDRVVP